MKENDEKEINLWDLIRIFFNWLNRLVIGFLNLIGNALRLLYRHKIITIVILVLSIAVALFLSRPSNRRYKAEAMALINGSLAQTVKEVSKQLESFSILDNHTTLSAKLSLPDSIALNIEEIASYYVIDYLNDSTPDMIDFKGKHDLSDTLNVIMPNRLYFRVKTKNIQQMPQFQDAFLNYFNTNDHLVREFNAKKSYLARRIELADAEIKRIDSLAQISYLKEGDEHLRYVKNRLIVGEQYKQLFYRDLNNLQQQKMKDEMEYVNYKAPVVLSTDFIVSPKLERGPVWYLVISLLIGLGVSILISLLVEYRKSILNYLSK